VKPSAKSPPVNLPKDLPKDLHICFPLPALHVIGMMLMLIWTLQLDAVAIVEPCSKPANADLVF
jgi:hypothetical protein